MKTKWKEEFEKIVFGIDIMDIEDRQGWWETSGGADFGKKKKLELEQFVSRVEREGWKRGWKEACGTNSTRA